MKMNFLKLSIPVLGMVFGVLSAFTTIPEEESSLVLQKGYVDNVTPCDASIQCSPTGSIICEDSSERQVFGKINEADPTCPLTLYQPVQ